MGGREVVRDWERLKIRTEEVAADEWVLKDRVRDTFLREMSLLVQTAQKLKFRPNMLQSERLHDQCNIMTHMINVFEDCRSDLDILTESRQGSLCRSLTAILNCGQELMNLAEQLLTHNSNREETITRCESAHNFNRSVRADQELARLERVSFNLQEENARLLRDSSRWQSEAHRLQHEIDKLEDEKINSVNTVANLRSAEMAIHDLSKELDMKDKIIAEKETELSKLKQEYANPEKEIKELKDKLDDYQRRYFRVGS